MPELSILITHYNRPDSLKKCIAALRSIDFPFKYEIVVSDDCSKLENLQRIQSFSIDKLITSEFNSGLANNINRGIKNCSGKYLMYVQEDHLAKKELEEHIEECISILEEDRLDMIRLKANFRFKYLRLISEHFAEIPRLHIRNFYLNFFTYSDHPFIVKGD